MPRLTSLSSINPAIGFTTRVPTYKFSHEFYVGNSEWDSTVDSGNYIAADRIDFVDSNLVMVTAASDNIVQIWNIETGEFVTDIMKYLPYPNVVTYGFGKFRDYYVVGAAGQSAGDVGGTGIIHILDSTYQIVASLDDSGVYASGIGSLVAFDNNYIAATTLDRTLVDGVNLYGTLNIYDSNFKRIHKITYPKPFGGDGTGIGEPGASTSFNMGSTNVTQLQMSNGVVQIIGRYLPPDSDAAFSAISVGDGNYRRGAVLSFDAATGELLYVTGEPDSDFTSGSLFASNYSVNSPSNNRIHSISPNYFLIGAYGADSSTEINVGRSYLFYLSDGTLAKTFRQPQDPIPDTLQYSNRFGMQNNISTDEKDIFIRAFVSDFDELGFTYDYPTYVYSASNFEHYQTIFDSHFAHGTISNGKYLIRWPNFYKNEIDSDNPLNNDKVRVWKKSL